MTIFQLECFYALSQLLNFTQTANQQFITQPALSRNISALESELGIELINRTTRRVLLTPAGQVFADECKKTIDIYQSGVQKTLLATQKLIGSVRLGVPIDSFEPLAVHLVQELSNRHSGIHVELKFNSPSGLIRALDDGLSDIVIASGRPRNPNSQYLLLAQRQDCAVLPLNHPLAGRTEINFSELRHENFVAISRASSVAGYESILTHAAGAGFTPNIISQAETISSLLMQIACGIGISILYKEHQPPMADTSLVFVPLADARPFNRYLIWNKRDDLCLNTLIGVAQEIFPQKKAGD